MVQEYVHFLQSIKSFFHHEHSTCSVILPLFIYQVINLKEQSGNFFKVLMTNDLDLVSILNQFLLQNDAFFGIHVSESVLDFIDDFESGIPLFGNLIYVLL